MSAGWTVELPVEWRTAPFWEQFVEVVATVELPRGRQALVVHSLLTDGTNILAMTWDRGARLARSGPPEWGIEERFTGRPPGPGEGALISGWRVGIDAMVAAGKDATAELNADPDLAEIKGHAVYCVRTPDAMDMAWERFRAEHDSLTREEFEAAILEVSGLPEVMVRRRGGAAT